MINEDLIDHNNISDFAKGLLDSDDGVKDFTTRSIENIKPELRQKAAEIVAELIKHKDIQIRNLANEILQKLGEFGASALREYLNDEDFDVRKFAVDIIGLTGEIDDIQRIMDKIEDDDANVVVSAIEAVGNLVANYYENINATDIINKLEDVYIKDEELRPIIIEAIGKTNSLEGESFILRILESTDDEFIRTACIDALALGGNSAEICDRLMQQLPSSNKQFQLIILRTIFAIAYRLELKIELPDDLRYIAHNALKDNDEEVRSAGLLALGTNFIKDDVPYLITKFDEDDYDTHQYILFYLLSSSPSETVEEFLKQYGVKFFEYNPLGTELDFYGILASVWEQASDEDRVIAAQKMYDLAIRYAKGKAFEIVDIMYKLEKEIVSESIERTLDSGVEDDIYEALDIIDQLKLPEFKNKIKSMKWNNDKLDYKASSIIF
jgi:HEAT repeat protein